MESLLAALLLLAPRPIAAAPTAVAFTESELRSQYYADLGPEELDVSSYPPERRRQYATFKRVCAQCHTLARAINAPTASRAGWSAYMVEMRLRAGGGPERVSREEAREISDFLAFDGKLRKLDDREAFDASTRRLQKRFWETIVERMRRLQDSPRPAP